MAVHTEHFDRLMQWCSDHHLPTCPLSIDMILKYCLVLEASECGPTVLSSVRASIAWVSCRLRFTVPDLYDQRLIAPESDVVEKRAKELKEAISFPITLVTAL